ncbi:MAG TPA: CBASS cGAMP synthase [Tissierellaceae bacterium]
MANLNSLFLTFNENITLSATKEENLKTGRNALREKIKKNFQENGRNTPKFCWQGSFAMRTIINPLGDNEYDIDDGVYLQGYSDKDKSEWPATTTVHNWILNAVDGHTDTPPVNKNTCVRVIYANNYHIDLPAYIIKDDVAYLAHKKDGWVESDPKAFTDWFVGKVQDNGEQLRRLVKYMKAWKDYKDVDLKGIAITILVSNNFYSYDNRDDKSLLGTVTNIIDTLEEKFECIKPVKPNEDLFKDFSESKKENIFNALKRLKDSLDEAINEEDEEKASEVLREQFGDRFPKGKPKKENEMSSPFIKTKSPGVINNDGHSA